MPMDTSRRRAGPLTLAEASALLAAIAWGVAFIGLSRAEPPGPPEPYAACSEKADGDACQAQYRSAVLAGRCRREGKAPLHCRPRTVRSFELPIPPDSGPAEQRADRTTDAVSR